ncbi:hypothetical protein QR680_004756 [Steinernema hermaphroditum]|uniref:Uncharacterized protein n=1 Tax=Steinernema hermaphroditum TaxID=289476 RepID=A0AA39HQW9_9BILA|nr:hypothetical protein QR680_004756 [Steinernema hermaphroditum]
MTDSDVRVQRAVASSLVKFGSSTECGTLTNIFHHDVPKEYISSVFPAVLGMSGKYRFDNECVDYTLEQNLSAVLNKIYGVVTLSSEESLGGAVLVLQKLAEHFHPSVYRQSWISVIRRSDSLKGGLLELLVEWSEFACHTPGTLSLILSLTASIFAGVTEGNFIRVLMEQDLMRKQTIAPIPEDSLMNHLLLTPLRILNMYYTIISEERLRIASLNASLFSRPNSTRQGNHNRTVEISNLVGTGVHPAKSSSFLNSPCLKDFFPVMQGAYRNYLSSLNSDIQDRFTGLLEAAVQNLADVFEMMTYRAIQPLYEEIMMYAKTAVDICPVATVRLFHQMVKALFGSNAASISLDNLRAIRLNDSVPPTDAIEMYLLRSVNDFTLFSVFLTRTEFMDIHITRHLGWLNKEVLNKSNAGSSSDINSGLHLFENFVTNLILLYQSTNDVEVRKTILSMMCELILNDVRYDLVDPNKTLYNTVIDQIRNLQLRNTKMLREIFLYFVCLTRVSFIPFADVVGYAVDLVRRADSENIYPVLDAVHILVCEGLFMRNEPMEEIENTLVSRSEDLFEWVPGAVTQIWALMIHAARSSKNELRWCNISNEYFELYKTHCCLNLESPVPLATFFSCLYSLCVCSTAAFRPVDDFVGVFLSLFRFANPEISAVLSHSSTLLFVLLSHFAEDVFLSRLEKNGENPSSLLAKSLCDVIRLSFEALEHQKKDDLQALTIFYLQLLAYGIRTDKIPKIGEALVRELLELDPSILLFLASEHTKVFSYFVSLLSAMGLFEQQFLDVCLQNGNTEHLRKLVLLLTLSQNSVDYSALSSENFVLLLRMVDSERIIKIFQSMEEENRRELFDRVRYLVDQSMDLSDQLKIEAVAATFRYNSGIENGAETDLDIQITGNKVETVEGTVKWALRTMKTHPEKLPDLLQFVEDAPTAIDDIVKFLDPKYRTAFLEGCLEVAARIFRQNIESPADSSEQASANDIVTKCWKVALRSQLSTDEMIRLLSKFNSISPVLTHFRDFDSDAQTEFIVNCFVEYTCEVLEYDSLPEPHSDFFDALSFFFSHHEILQKYGNDFETLEGLSPLIETLVLIFERMASENSTLKINPRHWNIMVTSSGNKGSSIKDEIQSCFSFVQRIVHLFRTGAIRSERLEAISFALKAILRLPLFMSFAVVPSSALEQDWVLRINARVDRIVVPLVNIHMLTNVNVLSDFVWRAVWLGWFSRSQFEDFWMSLFGVLSSTPCGDELSSADGSHNTMEQINASCIAVDALKNILLQTLLYPYPGDTVKSRFVLKHREKEDTFLESEMGVKAATVKAKANRVPVVIALKENVERIGYDGKTYEMCQQSVMALWGITGVLNKERVNEDQNQEALRPLSNSASEYLLKMSSDLDTASSLRALFDNFTHWFSRGFEKLPVPLLSSSLNAIVLLSDMFDDISAYTILYGHMRSLFMSRILEDHYTLGFVIYALLKCVTVAGMEHCEQGQNLQDSVKRIQTYVEAGLSSRYSEVRTSTLYGVLYLLQSCSVDTHKQLVLFLTNFLVCELGRCLSATDPIYLCGSPETVEYQKIVWTVCFRMSEEAQPLGSNFQKNFCEMLCDTFLQPNLPEWTMDVITPGIESLVVHSRNFAPMFWPVALTCFRRYYSMPSKFPHALSVFSVCLLRDESNQKGDKVQPFLDLVFQILGESQNPEHVDLILRVFNDLLEVVFDTATAIEMLANVLLASPKKDSRAKLRNERILNLFYKMMERLRADSTAMNANLLPIISVLLRIKLIDDYSYARWLFITFMCSCSPDKWISRRFHVALCMKPEQLDQQFVSEVFEYFSNMLKNEYDIDEERESIFDVIRFFYNPDESCET